jgi:hypothetical protein
MQYKHPVPERGDSTRSADYSTEIVYESLQYVLATVAPRVNLHNIKTM